MLGDTSNNVASLVHKSFDYNATILSWLFFISSEFVEILQNRNVLKISQDPLGKPGKRVARKEHIDFFTRPVHPILKGRPSYVAVLYNRLNSNKIFKAIKIDCHV